MGRCRVSVRSLLAALAASVLFALPAHAADVTNCDDTGPGSLRDAITQANLAPGPDAITFSVSPCYVALTSPLPPITGPVTLDASSGGGGPGFGLDGSAAGTAADGLTVTSSESDGPTLVKGLSVIDFDGVGIRLEGSGIAVEGSHIGVALDGTTAAGNTGDGVRVNGTSNRVGGTAAGAGNVISANADGVKLTPTFGGTLQGNLIGTDASGNADLGNRGAGVYAAGRGNTIGGTTPGAGNLISGNSRHGIELPSGGSSNSGHSIRGNRIGVRRDGLAPLPNGGHGVFEVSAGVSIGGAEPGAGNLISGNAASGVRISSAEVQGNLIGVGADGATPVPNGDHGVEAGGGHVGAASAESANVIRFNGDHGIVTNEFTGSIDIGRNSISDNAGMAFDAAGDGPSPNDDDDPDSGPNIQNHPVLAGAVTADDGTTTIVGTLDTNPHRRALIRFYSNPPGGDEAETYVGETEVSTDIRGNASFTFAAPVSVPRGRTITAMAVGHHEFSSRFDISSEVSPPVNVGAPAGPTPEEPTPPTPAPSGLRFRATGFEGGFRQVRFVVRNLSHDTVPLVIRGRDGRVRLGRSAGRRFRTRRVTLEPRGRKRVRLKVPRSQRKRIRRALRTRRVVKRVVRIRIRDAETGQVKRYRVRAKVKRRRR